MQKILKSILEINSQVLVMGVGRSFKKTCDESHGQFLQFTQQTSICLNPFTSIPVNNPDMAEDSLAMLKSVLILMAAPTRGVDDLESSMLEQAIKITWLQYKQNSDISKIADFLLNSKDEKAKNLGTMLYPFTNEGSYGKFFNGPANVSLDNRLVVVELGELKESKDLQAVVMQMFILNVTNKVFSSDRKTSFAIVFDEAWDLLRDKQSRVFLETLAKRLGKYKGLLKEATEGACILTAL